VVDPTHELASWGRRLAALLLDGLILGVIVVATLVGAGVPLEDINTTILEGSSLALILIVILPKAIYDTAMIGSRNQTFGKMALHIKVVDEADRVTPIGYGRAFTRWLSTAFLWALFLSLYVWAFMLAVGVDKGTATIVGLVSFGAFFVCVRVYGENQEA